MPKIYPCTQYQDRHTGLWGFIVGGVESLAILDAGQAAQVKLYLGRPGHEDMTRRWLGSDRWTPLTVVYARQAMRRAGEAEMPKIPAHRLPRWLG